MFQSILNSVGEGTNESEAYVALHDNKFHVAKSGLNLPKECVYGPIRIKVKM